MQFIYVGFPTPAVIGAIIRDRSLQALICV